MNDTKFQTLIWDFYRQHTRIFPWRQTRDPYRILVSEIMLQQTQTDRVVPKYEAFLTAFPNFKTLASASVSGVLKLWSGLGYNRRALFLQKCAKTIVEKYGGKLPEQEKELLSLPGIGKYTARALQAFVWDTKVIFIETNIRRVFIHEYFQDRGNVHDNEIFPYIEETLPDKNFREWYYALMDYGAYLGKTIENPNKRSKHYTKQSKFQGSRRQLRGKLLRVALDLGTLDFDHRELQGYDREKILEIWRELKTEGLVD